METDLRCEILDTMQNNIINWDGTPEEGIRIVETNEVLLDKLMSINERLNKLPQSIKNNKDYESGLSLLLERQKDFTKKLKDMQVEMLQAVEQFNKKQKIIKDYISEERKAIFINKTL